MKFSVLAILALIFSLAYPSLAANHARPLSPLALFQSRTGWAALETLYLDALACKFDTVEEALAFALLCEESGILENDIQAHATSATPGSHDTVVGTAAALNEYGSTLGSDEDFGEAIDAFRFAILLDHQCVPSHMGLASSHEGRLEYTKAIAVLDATPRTMVVGNGTLDYSFELAFQKMMVLAAVLRDGRSPQNRVALIAQMHEAKTLGQNSISGGFLENGIHGEDAVVGRRERLLFIDRYLGKLEP